MCVQEKSHAVKVWNGRLGVEHVYEKIKQKRFVVSTMALNNIILRGMEWKHFWKNVVFFKKGIKSFLGKNAHLRQGF